MYFILYILHILIDIHTCVDICFHIKKTFVKMNMTKMNICDYLLKNISPQKSVSVEVRYKYCYGKT